MQAPAPIVIMRGSDFVIEVANPAWLRVIGRTAEGVVGKPLLDALPELRGQGLDELLRDVLRTGETRAGEERLVPLDRRGDGKLEDVYFDFVYAPLRSPEGEITHAMAIGLDVTERVVGRKRIEELRQTAEDASRAKDDFFSSLSHELRTPLNAIVGWSNMLRRNAVAADQMPKALETIERNARLQARLIDDMLDMARIEQGKMVLSVGPVEMVRVVEAATDAVRPAAEAKGVRLQPVLDSHATIIGDADRLQQVVWNLLSNAIKFTPRGGRVQVRLRREHSYVEIAVADDGQGIEPAFLPHVFDRFRQADPAITRKTGGLGLGLAIVRSIVELHGGTVTAQSDGPGRGATFSVRLPTAPLRADSLTPAQREAGDEAPPTFECPPALEGLRILVVDDEPETRELMRFVLEQCRSRVTLAVGPDEALETLQAGEFDVLVSDIGMPEKDGYWLVEQVRALPGDRGGRIPAVALTAYARSEDRTRALKAGYDMHLTKPIEPTELLVVVATLVEGVRRRRGREG
jgi:PAS domain S-box-containing protein